jgi:4-amino-4-deoxy-L-arabinose transferase-like glycosyltransferase
VRRCHPSVRKSYLIILQTGVSWVATALLLLMGAWALSLFVWQGLLALTFPYPLDYGEGPLLDQAARLADFRNIYPADITEPPYLVSNYPPLFVLLQVPLVWLFGPELWFGRAISLAATIIVLVLITLTLHTLTKDKIASALSGVLFLTVPYVLRWSYLSRVDMMGLALSWVGIYLVVRKPGSRGGVVLAAFLMVAAIYTRQTYALAAPLAAFVWLLSKHQQRQALTLAVTIGGTSLGLLAILSVLTEGGFFFHTVIANMNEFFWGQVAFYIRGLLRLMPVLLAGAVAFLVLGLRSREASWWLVITYLFGGLATACLIGKDGAFFNYLLELSAALALVAGALVARYAGHSGVRSVLLLAAAVQVIIMVQTPQSFYADIQANVISQRDGMKRLQEIVAASENPVLADEYMGLLPLNGRRIYIQPFETSQLAREDKWDQRPFVQSIKRRKFEAIVISGSPKLAKSRWTASMLNAIHSNYKPTETIAGTKVYRPRNQGRSR